MHHKKGGLHMLSWWLLVIGGLNWLLVGIIQWDIGALFGGMDNIISRIIYILVGLSALYLLFAKGGKKAETAGGGGMQQGGGQM